MINIYQNIPNTQTHINHNYHIYITHCSYKILALSYLYYAINPPQNWVITVSPSTLHSCPPDGVATTRAKRCFISHPSSSAEICSLNSATFSRSLSTKGSSSWWQFLRWRGWYNLTHHHPKKRKGQQKTTLQYGSTCTLVFFIMSFKCWLMLFLVGEFGSGVTASFYNCLLIAPMSQRPPNLSGLGHSSLQYSYWVRMYPPKCAAFRSLGMIEVMFSKEYPVGDPFLRLRFDTFKDDNDFPLFLQLQKTFQISLWHGWFVHNAPIYLVTAIQFQLRLAYSKNTTAAFKARDIDMNSQRNVLLGKLCHNTLTQNKFIPLG